MRVSSAMQGEHNRLALTQACSASPCALERRRDVRERDLDRSIRTLRRPRRALPLRLALARDLVELVACEAR